MADSITPLEPNERRVLGVLIEKQKTSKSPDAYPMTLNAIITGCNQKSNRHPITDFDDVDAEDTLEQLMGKGLVNKLVGGRTDRYRHLLYEVWRISKVEMAILAELILRGSQSEGDLRGRASRMDDITDLETLRTLLQGLTERGMVVYLTEPGRRGTIVTHGFWETDEMEHERSQLGNVVPDSVPTPTRSSNVTTLEARLEEAFAEIEKLKQRVATLEG